MKTINLGLALMALALLTTAATAQQPTPIDGDYYEDYGYEDVGPGYETGPTYYGGNYYYHKSWGRPVAQVVPPTASLHFSYSRTVGGTTVNPIYPQFWGPDMGMQMMGGMEPGMYRPTPYWPTHTSQFGVYYVRGPW